MNYMFQYSLFKFHYNQNLEIVNIVKGEFMHKFDRIILAISTKGYVNKKTAVETAVDGSDMIIARRSQEGWKGAGMPG